MAICRDIIKLIPPLPGVYCFYNKENEIIYIGKAKNLKNRVSQYFNSTHTLSAKTRIMVSKIERIDHTVVNNEHDAFLLENNLIKEHQPRYNIMLKDSKTYPWIIITKEPFPRVFLTRKREKGSGAYFGPYSSVKDIKELLELIFSIHKIRNCRLSLTTESITAKKYKPCLNMHIGKCYAPCIGAISREAYLEQIENITLILNGEYASLIKRFKKKMSEYSSEMRYEEAQELKEKIDILNRYNSKSLIVSQNNSNIDVFTLSFEANLAFGNFLRITKGSITQSANMHFILPIEEERGIIMNRFISEIEQNIGQLSPEIIVEFMPEHLFANSHIFIPQRGEKLKLLELSKKNNLIFKTEKLKQESILRPEEQKERILTALKDDLNMDKLPVHIECFDNSNIQGTDPVSACVVFKNGIPSKKDYRHFIVKTVVGANDFETMREVVHRRYARILRENGDLPDLIIIDGGKGQLTSAYNALKELGLEKSIKLIGIAERLEELIVPKEPYPLFLDKNSSSLRLIMHLRNEAHRFGITHHRNRRSKRQITSILQKIPGIGEKTEIRLLSHFKSVKGIKNSSKEELIKIVGEKIAAKITTHLIEQKS